MSAADADSRESACCTETLDYEAVDRSLAGGRRRDRRRGQGQELRMEAV